MALGEEYVPGAMPLAGTTLVIVILLALAAYIYMALALMTIANRTKTPNSWLAWIPIANLYLITQIAQVPWWTMLIAIFAGIIPVLGAFVAMGISAWWFWKIAERRHRPGWWGILTLLPIVNFVIVGILAWGK